MNKAELKRTTLTFLLHLLLEVKFSNAILFLLHISFCEVNVISRGKNH